MDSLKLAMAEKIPADIRDSILDSELIDKAVNVALPDTPMEYLFDVYQFFIDSRHEFNDWTCHKCRGHIINHWKELKPFLEQLRDEDSKYNNSM